MCTLQARCTTPLLGISGPLRLTSLGKSKLALLVLIVDIIIKANVDGMTINGMGWTEHALFLVTLHSLVDINMLALVLTHQRRKALVMIHQKPFHLLQASSAFKTRRSYHCIHVCLLALSCVYTAACSMTTKCNIFEDVQG